jgi:5-carboxymethyl-2-hydroxymuconate isomerase
MPHIWIECSANVEQEPEVRGLKKRLQQAVIAAEIFPLPGLRIRCNVVRDYLVADDHPDNAFVHVVLRMGAGRAADAKKAAGEGIFAAICDQLKPLSDRRRLAISFEVQEMDPVLNFKRNNLHARLEAGAGAQ